MLLLDIPAIKSMISTTGLEPFILKLITQLEKDFINWDQFYKTPRHASHYDHGVIELMPCSDDTFYSFKYVNGHPKNTHEGKLCVAAMGLLADVDSGYPLMISEMTLLTAIRTAAVAALGAKYLARQNSSRLAIIGAGAQSEFQAMAMKAVLPIESIKIYDPDSKAMEKFTQNVSAEFNNITSCDSVASTVSDADIIVTATATKKSVCLFTEHDIRPGTHIHAMGGDCPGKTELGIELLKQAKLVVEYTEQSMIEGEIQQLDEHSIYAELWQILNKTKPGRQNEQEITIFDSVGFALEDFSTLKMIYHEADKLKLGTHIDLVPDLQNPKNLYGLLNS